MLDSSLFGPQIDWGYLIEHGEAPPRKGASETVLAWREAVKTRFSTVSISYLLLWSGVNWILLTPGAGYLHRDTYCRIRQYSPQNLAATIRKLVAEVARDRATLFESGVGKYLTETYTDQELSPATAGLLSPLESNQRILATKELPGTLFTWNSKRVGSLTIYLLDYSLVGNYSPEPRRISVSKVAKRATGRGLYTDRLTSKSDKDKVLPPILLNKSEAIKRKYDPVLPGTVRTLQRESEKWTIQQQHQQIQQHQQLSNRLSQWILALLLIKQWPQYLPQRQPQNLDQYLSPLQH